MAEDSGDAAGFGAELRRSLAMRGLPADPAALRAEHEREQALFALVMNAARLRETPLQDLYADALKLARPGIDDAELHKAAERYAGFMAVCMDDPNLAGCEDEQGNPRWISLTPREESTGDGRIRPAGVLPSDKESAAPKAAKEEAPASEKQGGLRGFLFGGRKSGPDISEEIRRARGESGVVPPLRPRPMRSFVRMLLFTAAFAVVYHLLIRFGFIRPLL